MKILLVNHLLDPVTGGGTAERTFQIARFLAKVDICCTVLTLDIGITEERQAELGKLKLVAVPCLNERFYVPRLSSMEVCSLVADADIVHLSGHWTLLNAFVYRACRKLGKPYTFCPAGAFKPFGRSFWLKRLYDLLFGQQLAQSAAVCIAITDTERADFTTRGVPNERIVVIPNGIDPDAYHLENFEQAAADFRQASGVGDSRFILFLGRLNYIKGPDLLLEAFCSLQASFPDVHLVIAGPDGGLLADLKQTAADRNVASRVHFTGFLGGPAKVVALHASNLLVIPSRREAMSIVVLEGGICGCPVLFTDVCGIDEIAKENAGIMVPVSSELLSTAIARLLGTPDQAIAMASRMQRIVERDYLWKVQARRYLTLSERIVTS